MKITPLYLIRKKYNLTLSQISNDLSINHAHLSRMERMVAQPSADLAERIANYFGGEINEMQLLYPQRYTKRGEINDAS